MSQLHITSNHLLLQLLTSDLYIGHKLSTETVQSVQLANQFSFHPWKLCQYLRTKRSIKIFEYLRLRHNEDYVHRQLARYAAFFDTVADYPLDEQQRTAVVHDEDNCLVIAGAGSGKTMTIVAKIRFLTQQLGVDPKCILPVSFTNKSATSLREQINIEGIKPSTFHKFGLDVLRSVEGKSPHIFRDDGSDDLLRKFLKLACQDGPYLSTLNLFLQNYIRVPKSQFEFKTHGDYIQYMKDQNFSTYKQVATHFVGKKSYQNQTVKSVEECVIANFLLFNRIEYLYEKPYDFKSKKFGLDKVHKPNFTIKKQSGDVYLEHRCVNRQGTVPIFFARRHETWAEATSRYERMIKWKRRIHQNNSTILIETYSYEFSEGTMIGKLAKKLSDAGVELNPMTDDEIWETIQAVAPDQVFSFVGLIKTFLSLLKSNGHSIKQARRLSNLQTNEILKQRSNIFMDLFEPIHNSYQQYLADNNQIDFSDMISRATRYITDGDYHCVFKYLLVDEFQDLSIGRYKLLQAIRSQNPYVKLFCVGDDWQSIYRFAGSDMSLFRDFETYFGMTHRALIETTYRFNDPMISASSIFILKNPNQTAKKLRAPQGTTPCSYSIIESEDYFGDDTQSLISAINQSFEYGATPSSSMFLIGRYTFDIKRIKNLKKQFNIDYKAGQISYFVTAGLYANETMTIQFVTAHKSKGLEADYAVLINCNSGRYGFPSEQVDDPLLNLLLSSADSYENAEERRLFYVAITRAKKHVIMLTNRYRKSKFIIELQIQDSPMTRFCPQCKTGELIMKTGSTIGRHWKFYSCTNYRYGCDYTQQFRDRSVLVPN